MVPQQWGAMLVDHLKSPFPLPHINQSCLVNEQYLSLLGLNCPPQRFFNEFLFVLGMCQLPKVKKLFRKVTEAPNFLEYSLQS